MEAWSKPERIQRHQREAIKPVICNIGKIDSNEVFNPSIITLNDSIFNSLLQIDSLVNFWWIFANPHVMILLLFALSIMLDALSTWFDDILLSTYCCLSYIFSFAWYIINKFTHSNLKKIGGMTQQYTIIWNKLALNKGTNVKRPNNMLFIWSKLTLNKGPHND